MLCSAFGDATGSSEATALSSMMCSLYSAPSASVDRSNMVFFSMSGPSEPSADLACCSLF